MTQYEYDVVSMQDVSTFTIKEMLNHRGEQSWELISITGGPIVYYYFFKRKIVTLNS